MSVSTIETRAEAQSEEGPIGASFLIEPTGIRRFFTPEQFSEEQKLFYKTATDFSMQEILPRAREIDKRGIEMMPGFLRKAAELGLCAVEIPEKYEGLGLDITTAMLVNEGLTSVGSWTTPVDGYI